MSLLQWVFSVFCALVIVIISAGVAVLTSVVSTLLSAVCGAIFIIYVISRVIKEHFEESK